MPSYTAPVKDMMFLYDKLRDNKYYNELEKYNEVNSDLVKDILEEAAKINQNLILPLAKVGDENPAVLENGVVRTPPGYKEADSLEKAVQGVLDEGLRTKDIISKGMKEVSTSVMGDAIISKLQ